MPLSILRVGLEFAKSQSAGQSHLNSDATIAYEGHPQGGEGTHKGGRAPTRGGGHPQGGEGTHKGGRAPTRGGGHPQGAPLPVFSRRSALGRAPTRGAPTCLLSAFGPGEGTHKGRPYRLSSLGVRPWGGHPQGAPLPIVFSRRSALGRAPTRGAPTDCLLSAFGPGEGTHKGRPYRLSSLGVRPWGGRPQGAPLPIVFSQRSALGRAPTRGASTDCLLSAFCPEKGAHKGRLYRLSSRGVRPWEGRPQGAPLPIVFSRRSALGRAPTRGAPTDCLLSAFGPGEGTHKGCPYPIVFSRRFALGRAPTRGAPTDCLLSAFCPGEGTHKGRPYRLSSLGVRPWEGHPTDCLLAAFGPGEGAHKGRPYPIQAASRVFF